MTILEDEVPNIPGRSDEFNSLIKDCLTKDRIGRPVIEEVLQHRFLEGAENCMEKFLVDMQEYKLDQKTGTLSEDDEEEDLSSDGERSNTQKSGSESGQKLRKTFTTGKLGSESVVV